MRRVCFLVMYRSGSHLLRWLLEGGQRHPTFPPTPGGVWLRTLPPKRCRFLFDIYPTPSADLDHPEAYLTYWPTGGAGAESFYDSQPEGDWRFIYLLRDPRNWIESALVRCKGKPGHATPEEILKQQAEIFRDAVRGNLRPMRNDPRFRLFSFEKFAKDPQGELTQMLDFAGFRADTREVEGLMSSWAVDHPAYNTAHGDDGAGCNERWHSWTRRQCAIFKQVAGPELIEMSFEKNNSWGP